MVSVIILLMKSYSFSFTMILRQYIKLIAWMLFLTILSCRKDSTISFKSNQLLGTWNTTTLSTGGRPYTRWTFDSDYVYLVQDTSKVCQPVNNVTGFYKYWIEDNVLIMRYIGITNGLIPIPDTRRPIISVSDNEIVIDSPRQLLEKCP